MKKQKTIIGIDLNINTLDFLLSIDTKKEFVIRHMRLQTLY